MPSVMQVIQYAYFSICSPGNILKKLKIWAINSNFTEKNFNFIENNSNSMKFTQMNKAKIVIKFYWVALKFYLVY